MPGDKDAGKPKISLRNLRFPGLFCFRKIFGFRQIFLAPANFYVQRFDLRRMEPASLKNTCHLKRSRAPDKLACGSACSFAAARRTHTGISGGFTALKFFSCQGRRERLQQMPGALAPPGFGRGDYNPTAESRRWNPPLVEAGGTSGICYRLHFQQNHRKTGTY